LPLLLDGQRDEALELGPARLVLPRQEADGDAVAAGRRELLAEDAPEEAVGQLDHDPGAVARSRVGARRPPVLEVLKSPDRPDDRLVGRDAVELRDGADAAGVVLERGVVEADPAGRALPRDGGRRGAVRHRENLSRYGKGPAGIWS